LRYAAILPVPSGAARAGLAAGTAVGVAAAAHGIGQGQVNLLGVAWATAALLGPAWWLSRRERSWSAHALTQLAAQLAVHAALSGSASEAAHVPNDLMLYGHVVAAALTGCWLRWGERRAWAAARRLVSGVLPTRPVPPPPAPPRWRPHPPHPNDPRSYSSTP
jgi:hypothetical protein